MAEGNQDPKDPKKDEKVEVPLKLLEEMQKSMAELERKVAESDAKNAGLEEMFSKGAETEGKDKGLREKKNFEPKFRTVRLRQYPIAGNVDDQGYIIGWTNRGAYQEVDRTGVSPQTVDFIDVVFLGHEKTKDGKIKAEKVKLLDIMNKGTQVHCKILEMKRDEKKVATGEEINVSIFDPAHGLVETGDVIDGYVTFSDIQYKIQVPGVADPVWVDGKFVN